jgi:signal transduction histidine kinase/ligand-binding sensor domain-containing protein
MDPHRVEFRFQLQIDTPRVIIKVFKTHFRVSGRLPNFMGIGAKILLALAIASFLYGFADAQPASMRGQKTNFLVKKWSTEDGLPQNTVTSMVQTADGYIWLGTFGGLARFDGVKFTVFDSTNAPGLRSNRILTLYEDRWKRLWIGTEAGEVYTLVDGKFTELESVPGFKRTTVWQILEDDFGRLFIASDSGLERIEFEQDGSIIPNTLRLISSQRSYKLAKGPNNTIWTTSGKAYVVSGDELVAAETLGYEIPKNILDLDFASDGRMVVSTTSSFGWIDKGEYSELKSDDAKIALFGCTPAFRANELWCQEGSRLHEVRDGDVVTYDLSEFVTEGSRQIFFDRSGNIWLATQSDGLVRLSPRKISLVGDLTDLHVWSRNALIEDSSGTVWLAAHDLLKVRDNKVEQIKVTTPSGDPELITSLAMDGNNVMWAGGSAALYTVKDGRIHAIPGSPPARTNSLFFDREAALWIGTERGLWRLKDDSFTHFTTEDGLIGDSVHFITQTKDGSIWIGTMAGASRFMDGRFENFTTENGLTANFVREILEDEDGTLWIGTYGGGIDRLRNGQFAAITTAQGLHDNYVSRILVDEANRFWILGNLGVFSVSREEMNAVADRTKSSMVGAGFGVWNGMKSSEASGGHQPAGIRTRDGRLWFPMIKDVVVIDPRDIDYQPPTVLIESVSSQVGDLPPSLSEGSALKRAIELGSGASNLAIKFTGIEFTNPERLRFFYKLEGLDENWVDASGSGPRVASYPYLPSGRYTFSVRALSSNGVWSEQTATVEINVAKRFWETGLFFLMCAVAVLLTIYFGYKIRVARLESRHKQQEDFSRRLIRSHETERLRLAGELHDAIGQNLLIMRNWAELALKHDALDNEARNHFEQISEVASNTLSETRTIVGNLSPQNLERFGLSEAVGSMVNQIERSSGIKFETHIEKVDDLLSNESQLAAYRSLQECLSNVVKHSGSPTARVEVRGAASGIEIAVEDVGRGFDTEHVFDEDLDGGGFGLRNIVQRVQLLGGSVRLKSEPGVLTSVFILIPKNEA